MSTCEFLNDYHYPKMRQVQSWFGLMEFEKTIFVLVNLMDIVMTFLLLQTGLFYESNPLAEYFINGWGLMGMIAFKLVLVAFVLAITNVVAIWKPKTAQGLMYTGIGMVGAVVVYSNFLLFRFG